MCISLWAQDCHPLYSLLLVSNRDELLSRPTLPAHWWGSDGNVLGGRDLKEGGTWLACSTRGRLALITNVREVGAVPNARSRGHLPTQFLESSKSPREYVEEVAPYADQYNGFNLLVADLCTGEIVCCSNRPNNAEVKAQQLPRGTHGLSNGYLDSSWPKIRLGLHKLNALLAETATQEISEERLLEHVLMDSHKADAATLPNTGMAKELEYEASSIFVDYQTPEGRFTTRSMTVLAVRKDGRATFKEKYLEDGAWKEHSFEFHIPVPSITAGSTDCRG